MAVHGARMAPAEANLVLSCTFYMISSAGMSIFNKLAVQALGLPIAIVVIQMGFTVVTCAASPSSIHIGSLRDALRWGLTVPILFAAMLVSSMIAMQYNTLGTVVVFRNIAPLITLAIESMFRIPMVVRACSQRDPILSFHTAPAPHPTPYPTSTRHEVRISPVKTCPCRRRAGLA